MPIPRLPGRRGAVDPGGRRRHLRRAGRGLPLVVLEAMACGCAPVVLRVAGTPEVVEDGATGLLAADESELARKVAELADDPKLAAALGERARTWSEEDGGIERQADQVAAVMRATSRRSRRRRRNAQLRGA
ncbi:MAG: glycosyltransferase [Ilumatobacteraceae bacterium]